MVAKKIKHILLDKEIKLVELAAGINSSQPNLSQKLSRDNFSEKEMAEIADFLDCDLIITFRDRKTGKEYCD